MGKLLFWVVVFALGWLAWSLVRVSERKRELGGDADGSAKSGAASSAKGAGSNGKRGQIGRPARLVCCKGCGIFVPASEAVHGEDGDYCSIQHRNAARRAARR